MTPGTDFSQYAFARRPAYPLYAKILICVLLLAFIGGIGMAIAEGASGSVYMKVIWIGASASAFLGLVVVGTCTARCTRCRGVATWFGITLDHAEAVAVKFQARRYGVDIALPYANGEACPAVAFDCYRCEACAIIFVTGVSDPSSS